MVRNSHYIDPREPTITSVTIALRDPDTDNPALGHISQPEGKHTTVTLTTDKYQKCKLFESVKLDPWTEPEGLLRETFIILVGL